MRTEALPSSILVPNDLDLLHAGVTGVGRWRPSDCVTCHGDLEFKWYGGDGEIVTWECDCRTQLILDRWLSMRGFSAWEKRIRRVDMNSVSANALSWAEEYAGSDAALRHNIRHGTSAVLRGNNGSGKTALSVLIAKGAGRIGFDSMVISMPDLIGVLRPWGDRRSWYERRLRNVDLLVLDDWGATSLDATKVASTIESIVRSRGSNYRSTIFTTNLSESAINDGYSHIIGPMLMNGHGMRDLSLGENWRKQASERLRQESASGLTRPVTLG